MVLVEPHEVRHRLPAQKALQPAKREGSEVAGSSTLASEPDPPASSHHRTCEEKGGGGSSSPAWFDPQSLVVSLC